MTPWKDALARLGYRVEEQFDTLKLRLQQRFNLLEPVQILPYRGHGNTHHVYLKGRVLEEKGVTGAADDDDTIWNNLLKMYQRFESDEIPGVRIRAQLYDMVQEVVTDDEGYFDLHFQPTSPLPTEQPWHPITLELLDQVVRDQGPVQATGQVLISASANDFGVISDIDDTILQTHATNLLKMARLTLLNSARTRLPFAGVAAFYQALQRGPGGTQANPIFYVSSSPWNLYDLLHDFLELNDIPVGPLFLRDLGIDRHKFITSGHHTHKLAQIEGLLTTYAELPFMLIGDSGQEDPEIYAQVVRDFPGRILAVYIRDVMQSRRDAEIHALAQELQAQHGELLLVPDTAAAAEHAVARGFIAPDTLAAIRNDTEQDLQAPTDVERLLE